MTEGLTFQKNKRAYVTDLNNLAMMNYRAVRMDTKVVERTPNIMGVRVLAGTVFFGSTVVSVSQTDLSISASHPSWDRIDLIVIDNIGTASVITGTPELEPHTPDYDTELYVVLARVLVDDLSLTITQSKISDLRVINEAVGTFGKYTESGIVSQTTQIVVHNLGDTEPMVACYDSTNKSVFPESITIDNANQVTVTFNPAFSGKIVVQGGAGSGGTGSTLTVKEMSGAVTVLGVDEIKVSDGTLTDNTGGSVSVDTTGVSAGTFIHTQGAASTSWSVPHNLGQLVVNVQCYDGANNWIQPNSITLTDAFNLVITFLSSESGSAIIKK